MSRAQSPSSVSQSSSFSVDLTNNPYISSYPQYYTQYYPPGPSTASQPLYNYQSNFQARPLTIVTNDVPNLESNRKKYTDEEFEIIKHTQARRFEKLKSDCTQVLEPDVETPFIDAADVVKRLLPYHLFQQPMDDLASILKGKAKAEDQANEFSRSQLNDTKFALQCFRRKEALRVKYHRILTKAAKRPAPDDQMYFLAQMLLEQDRTESALLSTELRSSRVELEKLERERRAAVTTYYRPYPYSYNQTYTGTIQPSPQTVQTAPPAPSPAPTFSTPTLAVPTTAIPVQLPVSSLPALHALGIIPVPAASLSPEGQAQTPAVLRGSTANGTMLSLEINVSLLHSAQMSGLALVLNSLVNRSIGNGSVAYPASASQPATNGMAEEANSGNAGHM